MALAVKQFSESEKRIKKFFEMEFQPGGDHSKNFVGHECFVVDVVVDVVVHVVVVVVDVVVVAVAAVVVVVVA